MKRIIALILSALLLTGLLPTFVHGEGTLALELSADKTRVARGETFTVTVKAASNPGFLLFSAAAGYDRTVFTQDGNVSYGEIGSGTQGKNALIDAGSADTTAAGVLFSFTLRVNDDAAQGSYTVGIKGPSGEQLDVVNSSEEDVPCSFDAITIEVTAAPIAGNAESAAAEPENTWEKGSGEDLEIPVKTPRSTPQKADEVTVTGKDGAEVAVTEKDYSFENGRFRLNKDFLAGLEEGEYHLTVRLGDQLIEEDFTVAAPAQNGGNDKNNLPVLLVAGGSVLALAAVAAVILVIVKKAKKPASEAKGSDTDKEEKKES